MTHVLIVEDQLSNIDVLGTLLELQGITYSWVLHPSMIDEALKDCPQVDIVFLDLEFAGAEGDTMLPDLRQHPCLLNARIVAYTAHISEIEMARRAGFDGFFGKPLNTLDFPNHIRRLLRGEEVWVV